MLEESEIDKYHEVLYHVHERESELILKHDKVVKSKVDWKTLGSAYLDKKELSMIEKFDEEKKKRIEYMTKVITNISKNGLRNLIKISFLIGWSGIF